MTKTEHRKFVATARKIFGGASRLFYGKPKAGSVDSSPIICDGNFGMKLPPEVHDDVCAAIKITPAPKAKRGVLYRGKNALPDEASAQFFAAFEPYGTTAPALDTAITMLDRHTARRGYVPTRIIATLKDVAGIKQNYISVDAGVCDSLPGETLRVTSALGHDLLVLGDVSHDTKVFMPTAIMAPRDAGDLREFLDMLYAIDARGLWTRLQGLYDEEMEGANSD